MKKKTKDGRPEPLPVSSNGDSPKGGNMSGFIVLFVCCVAAVFLVMWLYEKSEDTAYHKMQNSFNEFKAANDEKIKKLEDELTAVEDGVDHYKTALDGATAKYAELEAKFEIANARSKGAKVECARLQEHCAKLREGQIHLQDMISNKRPIVKVMGAIPVEIYTNPKSTNTGVPTSKNDKVPVKRGRPAKNQPTVRQ